MQEDQDIGNSVNHVVLYDGICRMCNGIVGFLLKRDSKQQFHFASIGGETAQEIAARHGIRPSQENSVILVKDFGSPEERVYRQSDAAFRCIWLLGWPWRILSYFRFVPRFIRDGVYRFIANRRFRWFGKLDSCPAPPSEFMDRFLP